MIAIAYMAFAGDPQPEIVALVERLKRDSIEFAGRWDDFTLRRFRPTNAVLDHPTLGRLSLTFTGFVSSAMRWSHDGAIIVLQPGADDDTLRHLSVPIASHVLDSRITTAAYREPA